MNAIDHQFGMMIVGGGPAGLAPLLAAHRMGRLDALLADGVAIIERSGKLGSGTIGNYAINSDSSGRTFVDCLTCNHDTELTRLMDHPLTQQLKAAGDGAVPLQDAGRFLGLVGDALTRMIAAQPASAALINHNAKWARRVAGGWHVQVRDCLTGRQQTLFAKNLILATGAHQPSERLVEEEICGVNLQKRCGDHLMQSGEVLTAAGLDRISKLLAGKAAPRVTIIGGSTSAAAVAHALLHRLPNVKFGEAGITLLHRRPLRIFYTDREAALAEGYDEWDENDVCPISGRVFRFAGFRLDSRELVMRARGIGGRAPEPRLRLHQIIDNSAARIIKQADLVIAAIGYRPLALPIFDQNGIGITLLSQTGPQMPMVDGQCRVMDAKNRFLPNAYGIGLAAGFLPRGPLGGEPSFRGQANGLWLWQHDVGALIVNATQEDNALEQESQIKVLKKFEAANLNISPENLAIATAD